jgi:hypothetical protein
VSHACTNHETNIYCKKWIYCRYLDEAVVEEEAYEPGLLAGGGFLHCVPHDLLRLRAPAVVGIVTDPEPRGRARRRKKRWEWKCKRHVGIRAWEAVAGIDWKFAGHGAEQRGDHSEKGKLGHLLPSYLLVSSGQLAARSRLEGRQDGMK